VTNTNTSPYHKALVITLGFAVVESFQPLIEVKALCQVIHDGIHYSAPIVFRGPSHRATDLIISQSTRSGIEVRLQKDIFHGLSVLTLVSVQKPCTHDDTRGSHR
jgi:hypothetical protein